MTLNPAKMKLTNCLLMAGWGEVICVIENKKLSWVRLFFLLR